MPYFADCCGELEISARTKFGEVRGAGSGEIVVVVAAAAADDDDDDDEKFERGRAIQILSSHRGVSRLNGVRRISFAELD